jgi:hypothetical protein
MNAFRALSWWFGDTPGRFAAVSRDRAYGDWLHYNPPSGGFWVSPGQYLPRLEPVALQAQAAAAFGVPAERVVVTAWGYPPAVRLVGPLALPAAGGASGVGDRPGRRRRRTSPHPTSGVPANRAGWPGLWLPAASTAFRPGEDPETWAVRMFYELVARELLDVDTMQAVDMLASAGVDTSTAEGAARFEAWSTGTEPDPGIDRITARQSWGLRRRAAADADRLVRIHRTHIAEIHAAFAARARPALPDGGRR